MEQQYYPQETEYAANAWKKTFNKTVAVFLFTVSVVIVLNPRIRTSVKHAVMSHKYTVLSSLTLQEPILGNLRVLKVRSGTSLILEIYQEHESNEIRLLQQITLPDYNDGYFHVNSQATNLATVDIDHDGIVEIIAPSFDENLVAHLNVYKLDKETKNYHQVFNDPEL